MSAVSNSDFSYVSELLDFIVCEALRHDDSWVCTCIVHVTFKEFLWEIFSASSCMFLTQSWICYVHTPCVCKALLPFGSRLIANPQILTAVQLRILDSWWLCWVYWFLTAMLRILILDGCVEDIDCWWLCRGYWFLTAVLKILILWFLTAVLGILNSFNCEGIPSSWLEIPHVRQHQWRDSWKKDRARNY
jgi:hypothetical protein